MRNRVIKNCEIIVIGGSAGSVDAVLQIIPRLPHDFSFSVVLILHRKPTSDNLLQNLLQNRTALKVKEAEDKEPILKGIVYLAPANYHLLIEADHTFSLDASEKINYSRPSIDITFECAAEAYSDKAIGIVLTGANADGAKGLKAIAANGGYCIVEDPATAQVPTMPEQAAKLVPYALTMPLEELSTFLSVLKN
jgi:two-component system chemotaxis response regulator CheB